MTFVVFFIQHILVAVERFLVELIKIHKKTSTSELVKEQHNRTGRHVKDASSLSCSE